MSTPETTTHDLSRLLPRTRTQVPRVLSIAGTDPTGGAGIHADLKSIAAFAGYGMGAVTAVVAQNTRGVRSIHMPPIEMLMDQLRSVSDDVQIDAVKIGMLGSADTIAAVTAWLADAQPEIVVLDPVMVASSGDRLLDEEAEEAMRSLVSRADLVTPNLAELAVLVEQPQAEDWQSALEQARTLAAETGTAVLLKGGHLDGQDAPDAIVTAEDAVEFPGERVETKNTHGTGCSLSSAMATLAAWGLTWPEALAEAKEWLTGALRAADDLNVGHGHGPVDHGHRLRTWVRPGSWSLGAWEDAEDVRRATDESEFIRRLADGTLEREDFVWYMEQDLLYLTDYSRVLARASQLAPTPEEQTFWATGAASCFEVEAQLHRANISTDTAVPSETTLAYTQHLQAVASTGTYAEVCAAVLPCYWLYQDVGERLGAAAAPGHPYEQWLTTYGTAEFREATTTAIRVTDRAAREASAAERASMARAFRRSMELELRFFNAPLERHADGGRDAAG